MLEQHKDKKPRKDKTPCKKDSRKDRDGRCQLPVQEVEVSVTIT